MGAPSQYCSCDFCRSVNWNDPAVQEYAANYFTPPTTKVRVPFYSRPQHNKRSKKK